jgi:hypothetical protein
MRARCSWCPLSSLAGCSISAPCSGTCAICFLEQSAVSRAEHCFALGIMLRSCLALAPRSVKCWSLPSQPRLASLAPRRATCCACLSVLCRAAAAMRRLRRCLVSPAATAPRFSVCDVLPSAAGTAPRFSLLCHITSRRGIARPMERVWSTSPTCSFSAAASHWRHAAAAMCCSLRSTAPSLSALRMALLWSARGAVHEISDRAICSLEQSTISLSASWSGVALALPLPALFRSRHHAPQLPRIGATQRQMLVSPLSTALSLAGATSRHVLCVHAPQVASDNLSVFGR